MIDVLIFAAGVSLGVFLKHKFSKPTTVNEYSGNVKNKVRGRGNSQAVEITADMTTSEFRKARRDLRNS